MESCILESQAYDGILRKTNPDNPQPNASLSFPDDSRLFILLLTKTHLSGS